MSIYAIFNRNNFDESVENKVIHTFEQKDKTEEQMIKAACRWIRKNYRAMYVSDDRSLWKSKNQGETYTRVSGLY